MTFLVPGPWENWPGKPGDRVEAVRDGPTPWQSGSLGATPDEDRVPFFRRGDRGTVQEWRPGEGPPDSSAVPIKWDKGRGSVDFAEVVNLRILSVVERVGELDR